MNHEHTYEQLCADKDKTDQKLLGYNQPPRLDS